MKLRILRLWARILAPFGVCVLDVRRGVWLYGVLEFSETDPRTEEHSFPADLHKN